MEPEFSATPLSGTDPLSVQFTDETTGGPSSWLWEFGDGKSSTDQHPLHIYSSSGIFTVILTVNGSQSITKINYITVRVSYTELVTLESGIQILTGLEILKEYYWPIIQIDSATQFRVNGDATGWFAAGNSIQLSSNKYSVIEVIDSITFSTPETIFVLSSGSVSSLDLDARVSRIYQVSDRILKKSLGDLSEAFEGSTLNAFQSSSFNCKLDNSDQWLLNTKGDSGILWNVSELLTATVVTETVITFTNCTLTANTLKGGVLTVLSGDAKNLEYPVILNTTGTVTVVGTLATDGVAIGDSQLVNSGAWFNLKFYAGLRASA